MIRIPSVNTIESIPGTDRKTALRIRKLMEAVYDGDQELLASGEAYLVLDSQCKRASRAMELIDKALETCGVEALNCEDKFVSHYWQHCVALYANNGDTYTATVLWDVDRDVFYVCSWGDWVETSERTRRYKFQ